MQAFVNKVSADKRSLLWKRFVTFKLQWGQRLGLAGAQDDVLIVAGEPGDLNRSRLASTSTVNRVFEPVSVGSSLTAGG